MKTVGDFKKAGLVFVEGDVISFDHEDELEVVDDGAADILNGDCCKSNRNARLKSFAWRTNTGEKPSFDGLIDEKWSNGMQYEGVCAAASDFSKNSGEDSGDAFLVAWRPSLNQGERNKPALSKDINENVKDEDCTNKALSPFYVGDNKPVYTKAMHEAGELPPIGSEFIDTLYDKERSVIAIAHHVGKVVYATGFNHMTVEYFHANAAECKPIQTERELAIEDMYGIYEKCESEVVKDTLGALYDAGYRKC